MPPATLEELSARLRREWARTYRSDFLGEEYTVYVMIPVGHTVTTPVLKILNM
jgi:hypothetical protein